MVNGVLILLAHCHLHDEFNYVRSLLEPIASLMIMSSAERVILRKGCTAIVLSHWWRDSSKATMLQSLPMVKQGQVGPLLVHPVCIMLA